MGWNTIQMAPNILTMKQIFIIAFLLISNFCFSQIAPKSNGFGGNEIDKRLDKWENKARLTEKEFYDLYPQFKGKMADPLMFDIPYHKYLGHKVDTLSCDSILKIYIVDVQIEKNVFMTFSIPMNKNEK